MSFSGLSGAICSPLLAQCITTFGWSTSYLVMAAIILLLTIPALVYPFTVRPQDMGLTPYGGERVQTVQKSDFDAMFLYKKVSFICLCVMTVLHTSIAGIAQHFTGFATSIEFTVEIGAFMMSLSMVGNIVTKLLIGVLSDKIGPVKSCVVMILLNAFSMLLFLLGSGSGSVAVLYVASFCYGSVYSVGAVGFSLLSKHFFGEKYFSKAYAVIGLLTYVGSALSLPLIGYLYDFTGSYQGMFLVTLGIHAVNLVLLTVIVKSYKKDYHTAK